MAPPGSQAFVVSRADMTCLQREESLGEHNVHSLDDPEPSHQQPRDITESRRQYRPGWRRITRAKSPRAISNNSIGNQPSGNVCRRWR